MQVSNASKTAIELWDYQVRGVIYDRAGNPVAGAIEDNPGFVLRSVTIPTGHMQPVRVDLHEKDCPG